MTWLKKNIDLIVILQSIWQSFGLIANNLSIRETLSCSVLIIMIFWFLVKVSANVVRETVGYNYAIIIWKINKQNKRETIISAEHCDIDFFIFFFTATHEKFNALRFLLQWLSNLTSRCCWRLSLQKMKELADSGSKIRVNHIQLGLSKDKSTEKRTSILTIAIFA